MYDDQRANMSSSLTATFPAPSLDCHMLNSPFVILFIYLFNLFKGFVPPPFPNGLRTSEKRAKLIFSLAPKLHDQVSKLSWTGWVQKTLI